MAPMTKSTITPTGSAGDMLFGMGGKLLYAATRVALPPLALAHMGLDEYGLWAACFVLVAYLGMAAAGFSLVYLRGTAGHHARGDTAAIGRLLSTGILAMGALTLVLMILLWLGLPLLLELFGVPPEQHALAQLLWLGVAGVFLADMSLGAFANVLHAIGRVRQEQQVWMVAFVLESVLIVALLAAGLGAVGLLGAFAGRYVFSASANAWLAHRALPGLRLSWRSFDATLLRGFFGYGLGMQLSGLLASALHSADRLIAGALLGAQATALVDLAAKLPTTAASVSSSVSAVAVSASARHDVRAQAQALEQVYRDASRITVAGLAMTLPFLAWFAQPLSVAWLGPGATQAAMAPLLVLASLGLHAHMLTGPGNAVSRGRGHLNADFCYHGLRFIALACSVGVWWALGSRSVPSLLSTLVLAQVVAALLFLPWSHHSLGGRWSALIRVVLVPSLTAHALAAALHTLWKAAQPTAPNGRIEAITSLLAPGALWALLASALLAHWLATPHERDALRQRLPRIRLWRNA